MKILGYCIRSWLLTWFSLVTYGVHAQLGTYTDEDTGIVFSAQTITSSSTEGGLVWGWVLPPDAATVTATEYIGLIIGSLNEDGGWAGISHGGSMLNALLLMGWPNSDEILTSFRYATGYDTPVLYTGEVTLTQISHSVNDTHYKIIYRCQGCWSWDQGGTTGSRDTTAGVMVIGWSQAYQFPDDPTDPDSTIVQHDTQGLFGAPVASAVHSSYSAWATMGGGGPTTTTTSPPITTTTTPPTVTGHPVPTDTVYDYVVVGGGAGGIPIADKLSESGASVLLIEKGPPSTYQWGGRLGPEWLDGQELTRFDVPGLCNQIWVDSAGIACSDIDQMAGCVLGGGTAVNAGLWWKAPDVDLDYNFPEGWRSSDMSPIVDRVFSRIPGTYIPSMDGKLYLQQGYDVLTSGLAAAGWDYVIANDVRNEKDKTYAHAPFMFSNGERGGPMATYLATASQRSNFKLWMNTAVRRVVRSGGHVTGVEVEARTNDGYTGTVKLTDLTGRVVLSAGTFGSAKILMRSGIGPQDMLEVVQGSVLDGDSMINSTQWINLPVGENLDDHTNTDTVITHPNVTFYDFYEAWDDPIPADEAAYLDHRSGILATAAPNIGPLMWEVVTPSDGIPRQIQWTSRVEASRDVESDYAMTMSQYLGRGSQSRGRLTITSALTMTVSTLPYLQNAGDVEAVIMAIQHLQDALSTVPNLEWQQPGPDQSAEDYVNDYIISASTRRANHWIGTAKIGSDDGRTGGTAVVDLNTRVWGMDNLFVADASIFPGMVTTNPSALVVTVAERAAEKILALPDLTPVDPYSVCGGMNYTGSHVCAEGTTCRYYHPWLSQCWPTD